MIARPDPNRTKGIDIGVITTLLVVGLLGGCMAIDRVDSSSPKFSDKVDPVLSTKEVNLEIPGLTVAILPFYGNPQFSIYGPLILPPFIPYWSGNEPDLSLKIVLSFISGNVEYSFSPMEIMLIRPDGTIARPEKVYFDPLSPRSCWSEKELEMDHQPIPLKERSCFNLHFEEVAGGREAFTLVIGGIRSSGEQVRLPKIQYVELRAWRGRSYP